MRLPFIFRIISSLCLTAARALSISLSKHSCPEKCGDVTIPYPFGIGAGCSLNSSFTVTCQNSTNSPTPILSSINLEVLEFFLQGTIIVNQRVSPLKCSYNDSTDHTLPISLLGSPFTISSKYNILVNLGCKNSVWLRTNSTTVGGGCMAICDRNSTDTSCNGINCCQTTIPERVQKLQYTYESIHTGNNNFCGYAFPVDKNWLQLEYKEHQGFQNDTLNPFDKDFGFVPLVLEWEIYPYEYYYGSKLYLLCMNSIIHSDAITDYEHNHQSTISYCQCNIGHEGNPYLPGGCSDIDECSNATLIERVCGSGSSCVNLDGSFSCLPPAGYPPAGSWDDIRSHRFRTRIKIAFIVIGNVIGTLILLYGAWRSVKFVRKAIKAIRRYTFYKRNGGLLLEQHLASTQNGLEKTKLFTSKELSQATDHYNENRILGRGGQGTVYKGMLTDGKIVAVKKSKKVDECDIEVFINEVVILSQINHRNVVKLLGCCLETEVPLLVYEFIPNGTLFHHIHEPNEDLPLTWDMRVRIATEVAGALAYLHCASSTPIYHRDIKSTNILLDDKYRGKVSDFGTSRSVAIDQTHVTTRVLGTFGYLDPEYFQSSQFTEKSDVYSFGVVMVELLTGEKAVTAVRAESGKSLATHFLHTMEENQLFDIIDVRVLSEGKTKEITAIAELAQRCLHLSGKRRPTMKDVAMDLEGIQRGVIEGLVSMQRRDHNMDYHSVEAPDESSDFSSISASTHMDTTSGYTREVVRLKLESPLLDEP